MSNENSSPKYVLAEPQTHPSTHLRPHVPRLHILAQPVVVGLTLAIQVLAEPQVRPCLTLLPGHLDLAGGEEAVALGGLQGMMWVPRCNDIRAIAISSSPLQVTPAELIALL
eukprot:scaffold15088_cov20-Tisochrysis_lutea.AAC.3